MVKDLDSFWVWVDSRMIEVGISSYRDLARRAGVSHGTINQAKNSLKVPTVEIAEGLCRALRVDWVELWSRAGFVDRLTVDRTALTPESLSGLDAEIYYSLRGCSDDFKRSVLKTIKIWQSELKD